MKLLFLSCPHGEEKFLKVPLDSINAVFLGGDIGKADLVRRLRMRYPGAASLDDKATKQEIVEMIKENVESSKKIFSYFSKRPVYFIYGNADYRREEVLEKNKKFRFRITPVEDSVKKITGIGQKTVSVGKLKVAGVDHFVEKEWAKDFLGQAGHRSESEAAAEKSARDFLSKLGKVDILLCHDPPYGFLDTVDNVGVVPDKWNGKHAGSHAILEYIRREQPRYAVCGHIHEAAGEVFIGRTRVVNTARRPLVLDV